MSPTPSIPTSTCFPSPTSPLSPIILPSTSKHLNTMVSTSTTTPPFNKSASSSPSPPPPTSTPTSISTKKPTLTTAPLPPSTMTKPLSPTSLSPCSRDVAPRIMSVPVAQISTSPVITSTVPNINSEGASTTSTAAHGRRSRSRSRNASTSTPPPSPPLSASDTAHKEGQNGAFDTHTRQRNTPHHHQQRNRRYNHHLTSVEVSTAAAAAAAASYTSQELAIAYSMVTSSVQETDEEGESKAATTTDQGSPKQQAKLDQIQSSTDSSDSLSTLWKKSAPLQEPYFQTRHTIASQHTLSTLDGVLFSLDEEPKEFNEGMYIAMRNRIFELEAKTVNYAPFNRSRKRSVDRSMDEYPGYGYGHGYDHAHQGRPPVHSGYDGEYGHSFKRAAYHHPHHPHRHSPPSPAYGPPRPEDRQNIYRYAPSYPSWYTPETYMSGSQPQHSGSKHVPTRAGDRELASSHSQVEHRNSRDSNGHDSGGPLSSPPRTLATKPQTVQPRPILPHRGAEAGGPTKMHHSPGSQPNRQSPPSHPSSTQYTHASPQSTEQPPTSTTPSQQQQLQQQQQEQQRQSFQQRQHRAQQQAQSDYSRSYHLQKHMRMLDQQRTLKLAQQQQQQQQQQQAQQPVKIQRQYQPHQQMYPHSSSNQASSTQSQLSLQQQQQQQQHQASRMLAIHHHQQQQQSAQQQLIQRYQAQRLLQQKQQQARQLQELRQRATIAQSISTGTTLAAMKAQSLARGNSTSSSNGGVAATNSIEGGGPRQKSARPLECSNCMALDSLTWRPRVESGASSTTSTQDPPATAAEPTSDSTNSKAERRLLCPACIQYWQAHGKCRPVPPFRVNFLKKIHSRFKKELQEVRFQGWQDAQVLEVEDRMTELDWKRVFSAASSFDEAAANVRSRQTSISSTAASSPVIHPAKTATPVSTAGTMEEGPIVIKIEDDDDDVSAIGSQQSLFSSGSTVATSSLPSSEVRTFMSEAAVGEVFGQRWKTEPMVGYTLVHFGGSDRTRMVPMNPTVPSLTVTFSRATESVVFAFRVLVNGLCLLSSGGGPPALHMPEMEEDEEESDEECDQDQDTPERDSREDKAEDEGEGEDVEMESAPWPDDLTPASSSLLSSSSAVGGAAGVTATTTTVID